MRNTARPIRTSYTMHPRYRVPSIPRVPCRSRLQPDKGAASAPKQHHKPPPHQPGTFCRPKDRPTIKAHYSSPPYASPHHPCRSRLQPDKGAASAPKQHHKPPPHQPGTFCRPKDRPTIKSAPWQNATPVA